MKILLGMSGGIDSSYAALKLIRAGHTVEGAIILMHEYTEVTEARESADHLGIPLHIIDARQLFSQRVIPNFIDEYRMARTPNPCIICNSDVKFRVLCDFARENGFDRVATGHYADVVSIETSAGVKYAVKRASDEKKDQTYMLWRLSQDCLSMLYFPLFDSKKEEIRKDAAESGLISADRADSQEICFIPSGDYAAFIEERIGESKKGSFVDENGNVLGEHKGIIHYTVGQRKGLGIALGSRAFVTNIDPESGDITLSTQNEPVREFKAVSMVFSGMAEPKSGDEMNLGVKVRYQAPITMAKVRFLSSDTALVFLESGAKAVAEGQSAVFYDGDVLVAGGFIRKA